MRFERRSVVAVPVAGAVVEEPWPVASVFGAVVSGGGGLRAGAFFLAGGRLRCRR